MSTRRVQCHRAGRGLRIRVARGDASTTVPAGFNGLLPPQLPKSPTATLNPAGSLPSSADRTLGRETTFPARQEDTPWMSGSKACSNLLKYLGPTSRQFEKAQSGTARASTPLLPADCRNFRHIEERSEHRLTDVQPLANFQNVLGC